MIYEFALEPTLLNSWERFRYLTEKFGVSQGRLISRYPKRWKALVYDALGGCSEIDKKRIEERLVRLDDRMMSRTSEWEPARDWLSNAENEHAKRPFRAIVAAANPRAKPEVLIADELDENTPGWIVKREIVVARQAADLANALSPLLYLAREIVFVDPHFDPYKPRARATLREFLVRASSRQNGIQIQRVEFHTSFREGIAEFDAECQRQLPQRIPAGISLRVVRLRERAGGEGFHNRYILTDRGGVRLAWGLDEGTVAQTDDLSLLDDGLFRTRWDQYCGTNPVFDIAGEVTIVGTL
ncbi:MAG: hypothetical protein EPO20_08000 [Betaproteobacteria bacterium]|nr:MAG: hypothetical protein EPO20_08000 [Betaproteobacteria bacterium]